MSAKTGTTALIEQGFGIKREFRVVFVPYLKAFAARGLWYLYSTDGMPLGEIMAHLLVKGLYPDWAYLVVEICAEGWREKRIEVFLSQEIEGVYRPEVAAVIRKGLARLCAGSRAVPAEVLA